MMRGILLKADQTNKDQDRSGFNWLSLLMPLAPVAAGVFAAIWYFILTISYDRFYGLFGVTLDEVGLNYIGILRSSIGLLLAAITVGMLILILTRLPSLLLYTGIWRQPNQHSRVAFQPRAIITSVIGVITLTGAFVLPAIADSKALDAKLGNQVLGPRIGPLVLLSIRVSRAWVEPIGNKDETAAVEALRGRPLQYLGQANSMLVLYDTISQQAVRLPASSALLRTDNCNRFSPCPIIVPGEVNCVTISKDTPDQITTVGVELKFSRLGFYYENEKLPFPRVVELIERGGTYLYMKVPGQTRKVDGILVAQHSAKKYLTTAIPENRSLLLSLPHC